MTNLAIKTNTRIYHTLTLIFIFCLLVSNIAEMKITSFLGVAQIGAGTLFFPLLYVMNDVITEVYGFSASRRTIWLALVCNLSFSLLMYGVVHLPDGSDWQEKEAFETIFTLSPRIMAGSLTSYFLGELVNSTIMSLLKLKLKGKMFAARAIFSTFIAAFIESIIFGMIAFYGRIPDDELVKMTITLALIKVLYEILVMPITTWLVIILKRTEKLDVYEQPSLRKVLPSW
jgi:uncharacterized integral membrane protein (TIGR00697 family)